MELRHLSPHDVHEATRAHDELAREGFEFLLDYEPGMDWVDFLDRTERLRQGVGLSETQVPATFLVADVGGQMVGRVSIRHHLNASLAVPEALSSQDTVTKSKLRYWITT
jgi:predicted acetyltransferase